MTIRRRMRCIPAILVLVAITVLSAAEESGSKIAVYYTPFAATTTVPVDPDSIESISACVFHLTPDDAEEISVLLKNTKRSPFYYFSGGFVRAKVENNNGEFVLIDSSGDMNRRHYVLLGERLTEAGKEAFEEKMRSLALKNPESCKIQPDSG